MQKWHVNSLSKGHACADLVQYSGYSLTSSCTIKRELGYSSTRLKSTRIRCALVSGTPSETHVAQQDPTLAGTFPQETVTSMDDVSDDFTFVCNSNVNTTGMTDIKMSGCKMVSSPSNVSNPLSPTAPLHSHDAPFRSTSSSTMTWKMQANGRSGGRCIRTTSRRVRKR